jgi:hypothetical protein
VAGFAMTRSFKQSDKIKGGSALPPQTPRAFAS